MTIERAFQVRHVTVGDEAVRPLLAGLAEEYNSRYGASNDLTRYPASDFTPPDGVFLVLMEDGVTIAGGAFRRYDETTAELKRIWTHPDHRRRGLGRVVVRELEEEAARRGYRHIYLTTGWRQPEATKLYLAAGYRPLFDVTADPETIEQPLPFEKAL
jgi:GNAT superfamily N-acetyltransferase